MIRRAAPAAACLAGGVLTAAMLAGCSALGALTAPSTGTATATTAAAPAAGTTTDAAPETPSGTTAAAVVESPTAAPVRLTPGQPVATDSPAPRTADVVLSFVGWNQKTSAVEAGGYLSPVVESGGTCTLALSKGSQTVTAVAPALADATTTSCGNLSVPRTRLTAGTWTAVLRYASKTTTGTSDPTPVTVPQ